jgi:oligosaccharide repeat unit polymerase
MQSAAGGHCARNCGLLRSHGPEGASGSQDAHAVLQRGEQRLPRMTLLNPAFAYAATWMFVLLIYSLRLSYLLDPLQAATVVLVVGTSLSFIAGWVLESLPNYGRLAGATMNLSALGEVINAVRIGRRLRVIWIVFALGISFEVAYFQAIPFLGLFGIGAPISYVDFGIPGFHGLLNSLFYAGCVVTFARILLGSSKRTWLLTMVSIAYPVLILSRQVLISLLVQYLCIYFSIRRPSFRIFVRTGILAIATLLMFGYVGDARSGRDSIIYLAAPTFDYPDWLPSAFIWVYIYLSSPLNNVNYNIDISPNFFPLETAGTFIPSFARDDVLAAFGYSQNQHWSLVSETFNVSSLLQGFLTDFGVTGAIVFTLLCGVVFSRVLRRSATSPAAFFALIILVHGIALSFFANLLFHLVFMFEMLTTTWLVGLSRRR